MSGFVKFGLLVTGEGERDFLPRLFRALTTLAGCSFEVIRKVEQLTPRTSTKKHVLRMPGRGGTIPTKDAERIGYPARSWLKAQRGRAFIMLVDDLEWDRREQQQQIFDRYREAFTLLSEADRRHVGVFFLVMMLEAYYFADPAAVAAALGVTLPERQPGDDVEQMRHPKNELKKCYDGFRELDHGGQIVPKLDLEKVLGDPQTCASLRAAVAWCHCALGLERSEQFQLVSGRLCPLTGSQVDALTASPAA